MHGFRLVAALMLSSALIGGMPAPVLSQTRDPAPEASFGMRDSWLTAKTKIALFADERVKGQRIDVETVNGTLTLRGQVDSAEAKAAAGTLARAIAGVTHVTNDLRIAPTNARPTFSISDEDITREVKDRFSRDGQLEKVGVRTDRGVVILTGAVPSIAASARASARAHEVAGVRSVKNELTYGDPMRQRSGRAHPRPDTRMEIDGIPPAPTRSRGDG